MAVPALALKVLGGSVAAAGTVGTGYLVWDNYLNSGLTSHDSALLSKSEEFKKLTWSSTNTNNSTATTGGDEQLKITFTSTTGSAQETNKIIGFKLEINKTDSNAIANGSGMKKWECVIAQENDGEQDLKVDTDSQIDKLKKSFGIGATGNKVNWTSIEKFIKECAYRVRKKEKLGADSTLSRQVNLKTQASGEKHEFVGLDKFFIEQTQAPAEGGST